MERAEGGWRLGAGKEAPPPRVSIITVVFGARDPLRELLANVRPFVDPRCELIVIDGGAGDGTVELLRENDDWIAYWLSEPDAGIYDAMNKGAAASRGEYLYHLNAGDQLLRIPWEELDRAAREGIEVAAFEVSVDGKRVFRPRVGWGLRFNNTLHHQGTFYRRGAFPGYDTGYRVFADFDVNQRLASGGARIRVFRGVIAVHSSAGVSNAGGAHEFFRVIRSNCGPVSAAIAWVLCKGRGLRAALAPVNPWTSES